MNYLRLPAILTTGVICMTTIHESKIKNSKINNGVIELIRIVYYSDEFKKDFVTHVCPFTPKMWNGLMDKMVLREKSQNNNSKNQDLVITRIEILELNLGHDSNRDLSQNVYDLSRMEDGLSIIKRIDY